MKRHVLTLADLTLGHLVREISTRLFKPKSSSKPVVNKPKRTRDTRRISDEQIAELVRYYQEIKFRNTKLLHKDRITQDDLTAWANNKFGFNKSRKTYMKIIKEALK